MFARVDARKLDEYNIYIHIRVLYAVKKKQQLEARAKCIPVNTPQQYFFNIYTYIYIEKKSERGEQHLGEKHYVHKQ